MTNKITFDELSEAVNRNTIETIKHNGSAVLITLEGGSEIEIRGDAYGSCFVNSIKQPNGEVRFVDTDKQNIHVSGGDKPMEGHQ